MIWEGPLGNFYFLVDFHVLLFQTHSNLIQKQFIKLLVLILPGTVAVIGIATTEAPNQCHGYVALLGSNDQSWGWNLVDNHLLHNGDSQGNYPQLNNAPKYQV